LSIQGKLDEAIAEYRKAIEIDPKYAPAHTNLGITLTGQGKLDEAMAELLKAVEVDPKLATAHNALGSALSKQGKLDEAVAEYRKAIELDPTHASRAHYNLGNVLWKQGKLGEASAAYRKALALEPDHAQAHCNLGLVLMQQGEFRQALDELRRGHELGSKNRNWRYPSAEWVRQCERLVELDEKLRGFLDGTAMPANAAERIQLAQVCYTKRLHRAAASLYAEAFTAEPKLADDLGASHRYNAARAAALAGCGVGNDADKLDEKEKAQLRGQALGWLRADLAAWTKEMAKNTPEARSAVREKMRHWQADADFAGVRAPEALAKLPEAERQPWQRLWDEVADLLSRAVAKKTPEERN
jgi:Tfp pilus assembly protein PilF